MNTYEDFINSKSQLCEGFGFEPIEVPKYLFPFQRSLVEWALRRGRAAVFASCGLGKTPIQLVWADNVIRHANKPVLILTPLAVSGQTVREADKFGIAAVQSRDGTVGKHITVTNYEQLKRFKAEDFAGVVCDECFPAGTLVDVPGGSGSVLKKRIENIRIGDTIINASGIDVVSGIHRREVGRAVQLQIAGRTITSSPNHPFFTQRGWVGAEGLEPGDSVLRTGTAVRMVREGLSPEDLSGRPQAVLLSVLLGEMEDEATAASCQGPHAGGGRQEGEDAISMAQVGRPSGESRDRTNPTPQPDGRSRGPREGVRPVESDRTQALCSGRERGGVDTASGGLTRSPRGRVGGGIPDPTRAEDAGPSDLLQGRPGESGTSSRHRSGWSLSLLAEGNGPEERRETDFARVESLEVLEPGDPRLERFRDAEGKLYFHDIGATRHPSFSVNGLLVHNSSVLKNFDGKTKAAVTEFMRLVPYRLLCSATPAPNDYIELGTSSEALGGMGHADMITKYFRQQLADRGGIGWGRQKYYLRSYAAHDFWCWVCSWARACRKPSDLGFDDDSRFDLPPLATREHVITANERRPGFLFDLPAVTLHEQREERRRTIRERCEKVAELVGGDRPAIVWCHLNTEGDLLAKIIPGAVQVSGSDSDESKEKAFLGFIDGKFRVLVSKPVIAAYGLNFQHCAHQTFFPSHSYEEFHQAVRRSWRFGQKSPVGVDIVTGEGEAGVKVNLARKTASAEAMFDKLIALMNDTANFRRENPFTKREESPPWLSSIR